MLGSSAHQSASGASLKYAITHVGSSLVGPDSERRATETRLAETGVHEQSKGEREAKGRSMELGFGLGFLASGLGPNPAAFLKPQSTPNRNTSRRKKSARLVRAADPEGLHTCQYHFFCRGCGILPAFDSSCTSVRGLSTGLLKNKHKAGVMMNCKDMKYALERKPAFTTRPSPIRVAQMWLGFPTARAFAGRSNQLCLRIWLPTTRRTFPRRLSR